MYSLAERLFPAMAKYGFTSHCDFRPKNMTIKHDQLILACKALSNIVKYVVCNIHSIQTRHNVITLC